MLLIITYLDRNLTCATLKFLMLLLFLYFFPFPQEKRNFEVCYNFFFFFNWVLNLKSVRK